MRVYRAGMMAFVSSWVSALMAASLAQGSQPSQPNADKPEAVEIVALLPIRVGPQPLQAVRALSLVQERIGAGDDAAFDKQGTVAAAIDRQLKAFPFDVWTAARNRHALVKFTLSGGNPDLLRTIAEKRMFTDAEIPLAHGALAYAEGHRKTALTYLAKVDVEKLGQSLAGHVTLIKAIITADTDMVSAARLSDIARLMSPGTLVEEAALRLSIELDIALGDKVRFEAHASQYLRRFHKSKFAVAVVSQIANFVAAHDYPANSARRAWLERVANRIAPERRAEIFIVMAELGLRSGKVAMTRYAARLAAASGVDRSLALAYEGAALVINPITAEGLERLAAAEGFSPATSTVELIAAARFVAAIIHAPAEVNLEVVAGSQVAAQSSPTVELAKARTAILNADKLLEETVN